LICSVAILFVLGKVMAARQSRIAAV
jgi:hypothetical protein